MDKVKDVHYNDCIQLDCEIDRFLMKKTNDRTTEGSQFPKTLNNKNKDYNGIKFSKKEIDLWCLVICSYYLKELQEWSSYIRVEILDYCENNMLFPLVNVSCQSKLSLIYSLLSYRTDISSYIFANALSEETIQRTIKNLQLKRLHYRKPVPKVRRRGAGDRTSRRRAVFLTEEDYRDFTFQEEYTYILEQQETYRNEVNSLYNDFKDWVNCHHLII